MKTTAFTKYHIANGAKMAEFAGYNMPIEFSGINDEHATVREKAGVFDVSHMGEIWVKGEKALDLLQHVPRQDREGDHGREDRGEAQGGGSRGVEGPAFHPEHRADGA